MKRSILVILISLLLSGSLLANSDIENTTALSLYKEKKYEEAIAICNSVLEKDSNNSDAIYIAAISNFMLKNYAEAEKLFARFLNFNQYNYEVIRYLSICKYYNGDYKGSISGFERIPKYQEDPLILIYLGLNYNRLQDKDNLELILKKIESNPRIEHKNKKEFIQIIKKAMDSDLQATTMLLKKMRDEYSNQFVISSKLISIEKNTKKDSSERFRLLLGINEVFDTNVLLYPDNDAIKLQDVRYGERYDLRTEARYSIGYKILDSSSNIFGILYNGYQGINSNLHQYNFNSNEFVLNYRFVKPLFYLSVNYTYNYDFISNNFDAYDFGHKINPEFGLGIGEKSVFAVGAPVLLRHYFEKVYSTDFDRSGLLVDPYIYFSYSTSPDFLIFNKDSFGINMSDGDAWKFMRPEIKIGIVYKYGRSIIVNAIAGYSYYMFSEKISNPDFLLDNNSDSRVDSRITFETGVDFRLYSDKLYLNTGYAFLMNMSNSKSGLYDFSRHIASLGIKFLY